jgi:hypothetical protein
MKRLVSLALLMLCAGTAMGQVVLSGEEAKVAIRKLERLDYLRALQPLDTAAINNLDRRNYALNDKVSALDSIVKADSLQLAKVNKQLNGSNTRAGFYKVTTIVAATVAAVFGILYAIK